MSAIFNAAERNPLALGLKLTLILQVELCASELPQQEELWMSQQVCYLPMAAQSMCPTVFDEIIVATVESHPSRTERDRTQDLH